MKAARPRGASAPRRGGAARARAFLVAALAALGAGAAAPAAPAEEPADAGWPRFRGPRGAAVAVVADVPASFTEADWNWCARLPGTGRSSPVVRGGRVFVTSAETPAGQSTGRRHVLCVDARDGRELWRRSFDFAPYRLNNLNAFAVSTPALDAQRVYVVWASAESVTVVALGHDGREAWRRDLGPFGAQHGPGASPAVIGGTLVLGNDQEAHESFLVGLDCADGSVRWREKRRSSKASYSTPAELVRGGRVEAVFASTSHGVTGLDPRTGELLWEAGGVFRQRCVSSPVIAGGLVFATAGEGGAGREAVAVRPGPGADGGQAEVVYRIAKDIPYVPTPVASGELLFMLGEGGALTCVRASTGEALGRVRLPGRFYASPVCAGGRLYLVSLDGDVFVLEASEGMKTLGRSPLGEASSATPAVSRGVMYFRTESRLISVGGHAKR